MNLNEECLLQFLKNDLPANLSGTANEQKAANLDEGSFLSRNLGRILRRNQYVSFPIAILLRRPHQDKE